MDHEGAGDAQRGERPRHRLQQGGIGDSEQLHLRLGRIEAGAEHVHDRAHLEHPTNRPGMAKAGVIERREQEADSDLVERLARSLRRHVELRAELLEHVGRSAARGDRAIAVLGDGQARRGGGEGDGGGDVDRGRAVAAGAAAVGEEIVGPGEIGVGGAQGAGGAGQLVRGLALEPESDQHGGDRGLGKLAGDKLGEQPLRFGFGQRFAGIEPGERGLGGRGFGRGKDVFRLRGHGVFPGSGAQKKRPAGSGGPCLETSNYQRVRFTIDGRAPRRRICPTTNARRARRPARKRRGRSRCGSRGSSSPPKSQLKACKSTAIQRRPVPTRHPGESRDLGTRSHRGSPSGPGFRRDDGSFSNGAGLGTLEEPAP